VHYIPPVYYDLKPFVCITPDGVHVMLNVQWLFLALLLAVHFKSPATEYFALDELFALDFV